MKTEKIPNLLTERQYQVAILLAEGKSIKQITSETGSSRSCIQFHLYNLRQRFGCTSNFQLGYELRPILDELTSSLERMKKEGIKQLHWPRPPKDQVIYEPIEETESLNYLPIEETDSWRNSQVEVLQ